MVNMTLAVSEELRKKMERHREIKWSEIARKAFERKIDEVELEERILSKSKLTEKDVNEIAHKINKEVFEEMNRK